MRTLRVLPAILILMFAATPTVGKVSKREVGKMVGEYLSDETPEERRSELLNTFRDLDASLLERPLKRAIRRNDEFRAALTLAAELEVPGLSSQVWPLVDEHPRLALDYLFRSPDKGVENRLIKRWHSEDVDGDLFSALNERMLSNWIGLEQLEEFRDALDDEIRGAAALEILQYQMLDDEASADDLKREWKSRMKELSHRAKSFELERRPLFDLDWNLAAATSIRENYSLSGGRKVFLKEIPDDWQTRNFSIRLRVFPHEAERMQFQLYTDPDGVAAFEFENGYWQFKLVTGEDPKLSASARQWSELEIRITNKQSDKDPHLRNCVMLVNGKELESPGGPFLLNGEFTHLEVQVMSGGEAFFGGGEWWYDE